MVDVDSEKWAQLGDSHTGPLRWIYRREARTLRQFERRLMRRAAATTVVSDRERVVAEKALGAPPISVPNGVDLQYWAPPSDQKKLPEVVFCGVFNYEPNERGAVWLATEVWPLVKQAEPSARLKLVGMHPSARVRNLASPGSIEVTGAVDDVRPHVWRASVSVAPLWLARGTQNKVLEALAAGLPCVVTPPVLEGLPKNVWEACLCRGDARGFADAVVGLLRGPRLVSPAVPRGIEELAWHTQLAPFLTLLEQARNSKLGVGEV